jgi:hypothetical protein
MIRRLLDDVLRLVAFGALTLTLMNAAAKSFEAADRWKGFCYIFAALLGFMATYVLVYLVSHDLNSMIRSAVISWAVTAVIVLLSLAIVGFPFAAAFAPLLAGLFNS